MRWRSGPAPQPGWAPAAKSTSIANPSPRAPFPYLGSVEVVEGGSNAAPFPHTPIPGFRIILGLENAPWLEARQTPLF